MKQPIKTDNMVKNNRKNQVKSVLVFLCITAVLISAVSFLLSPLASTLTYCVGARLSLDKIDVSDNGVSDYADIEALIKGKNDFAISILPSVPAGYTLVNDYLMFLNREMGVTKILLNISSEAGKMLTDGLNGGVDDDYYELTYGSFCASLEFKDFVSLVRALNQHLLPGNKIGFIGIADNPSEDYKKATEEYGTLLLMSREEAHASGGIGDVVTDDIGIADVYYVSASTSSENKITDLLLPLTAKGYYSIVRKNVKALTDYYNYTVKLNGTDENSTIGMITSDSDFFFVVAGGIADSAETAETDAEGEVIDYGV